MQLERLRLKNYRNYRHLTCEFSDRLNILYGANAQGKTNLVEAIYYIGNLKSFRFNSSKRISDDLIRKGEEVGAIDGRLVRDALSYDLSVRLYRDRKREILLNKNTITSKLSDYFEKIVILSFSPDDLFLIKGAPEKRRSFFDRFLFYIDPLHLDLCRAYERVLHQKLALLRQIGKMPFDQFNEQLDLWNYQMAKRSAEMVIRRRAIIAELLPIFQDFVSKIANKGEQVSITYNIERLAPSDFTTVALELSYLEAMRQLRAEEMRYGRALVGPHLDDIIFSMMTSEEDQEMRFVASQGQIRTAVLAVKLAQIELLRKMRGVAPILILDDVLSEFDSDRVAFIIDYLLQYNGQTFLTCVDPELIRLRLKDNLAKLMHISSGSVVT